MDTRCGRQDKLARILEWIPGKWDVRGNEAVREALKPSFYLASLLLTNSATWTWYVTPKLRQNTRVDVSRFNAFLFSPRKEFTPANLKDTKDGCKRSKIDIRVPSSRCYFRTTQPRDIRNVCGVAPSKN